VLLSSWDSIREYFVHEQFLTLTAGDAQVLGLAAWRARFYSGLSASPSGARPASGVRRTAMGVYVYGS